MVGWSVEVLEDVARDLGVCEEDVVGGYYRIGFGVGEGHVSVVETRGVLSELRGSQAQFPSKLR